METLGPTYGLEVFVEGQGGVVGVVEAEVFGAPGLGLEMAVGPDHAFGLVLFVERVDVFHADADLGRGGVFAGCGGLKVQADSAAAHAGVVDRLAGLGRVVEGVVKAELGFG